MIKKVVALLIFYLFTFNVIGPIEMASFSSVSGDYVEHSSQGSETAAGHYCVTFKGPCKHGESCPKKHLHRPMRASDLHSSNDHSKHVKHEKDILVIGSSCHSSDGQNNAKVITDRFVVSFTEEFDDFSIYTSLVPTSDVIYVSHIKDTPHRPPAV